MGVTPTTPTAKTPDLTKPLTEQQINAADGFILPVKQVAKEGDGAMSPWLMADGKIVGTGQDHIAFAGNVIDGPMPGGYSDFMNKTGAIRSAMFEDKTTGQYVVTLHMAEGQKPTKAQLESLTELEKERGKPIDIRIANKNGMVNPEYTPITLDQLRRESIDPKTAGFPEKIKAFVDELKINKTKKDAQAKVVQTAIRNKKTGEVTKLGPKHPEDLKKELGLMPIDKKTLEEAVAPWSDLPQEQQDLIRRYVELTHETSASEKSSDPKTWTLEEKAAYERGDTAEFSRLRGYSKEDIAKHKEWQKTTDDVIKLLGEDEAFGIVYFLDQKYTYSHEAGFVDANGRFLNRKEAWNRARDLGQVEKLSDIKVGLQSSDLRAANDKNFELFINRPVNLDDTTAPKYLYHGTRKDVEIDANGNLILRPAKNFGGKTNSVSLTHNLDYAEDYATRVKGGGPEGIDFNGSKIIKLHSDALPKDIFRENGEEWAVNTNDPLVIPKDKFEIIEHPLSKPKEGFDYSYFSQWGTDNYGKFGFEAALGEGKEGVLRKEWLQEQADVDITGDPKFSAQAAEYLKEINRLQEVTRKRMSGEYKEPVVQWDSDKSAKEPAPIPVDRTKTNPRDIKDQQEFKDIAQEIYEKHGEVEAVKFYEGYEQYKQSWNEPIAETEKFVGTNLRAKAADERIIHNNTSDLKALAGKEVDLNQLTYDIDRGTTLTGKVKEVADRFRTLMDDLGKKALENGVIKGWHQDYVARNVVTEGTAPPTAVQEFMKDIFGDGVSTGGIKTTTKYGETRKLETREDLVNHLQGINSWLASKGYDYRFKLKSNNLADIYHDYALSVEKAIENKNLINNLKQIRNANGESLIRPITPEDPLPYQWEVMDNSELAGYAVHPDLIPHLKFVFDAAPGELMSALGSISQFVKRINVIGSFFHAKSLMEVMSSTGIPIWTPLKEAIVLPLVEKGVKAITGKDIQLSAITKAIEQFKKGGVGTSTDKWIREDNLQLGVPEDVSKNILSSSGKLVDSLISEFGPKTRVLEKSLTTTEKYTLHYFDRYTWDYLHTGGKLMVAEAYLDKARLSAAKRGRPFDESATRKEIARFLNDSFGGLNWYDAATQTQNEFAKRMALAAYSPAGRRSLQIALFAPDWTISTLRAFSAALPKGLNPTKWQPVEGIKGMMTPTTKADYARLYQLKTALTYFTMLNAMNFITAGRYIWENKDPTRIEFPDGTSMQAMKHAMEPAHWIMDPTKTLANKLGFVPKAAIVSIAGTEYASPQAQKLVDPSAAGRLKAVASMAVPFQVAAARDAPPGEGAKRALLGTMGFPVYGGTPEQKKAARAEREKVLKEAAKKYHQKAKEKGWEK